MATPTVIIEKFTVKKKTVLQPKWRVVLKYSTMHKAIRIRLTRYRDERLQQTQKCWMEAIGNIEWDADTAKHPKQVKNTLNKLRTRRQKALKEGACRARALSAPTHSFTTGYQLWNKQPFKTHVKFLLELHKLGLPYKSSGGYVHVSGGCRSRMVRWLDTQDCQSRGNWRKRPKNSPVLDIAGDASMVEMVEKVKRFITAVTKKVHGKNWKHVVQNASLDLMLSFPGQKAQRPHIDAFTHAVACVIFVTEGLPTEFVNVPSKKYLLINAEAAAKDHVKSMFTSQQFKSPTDGKPLPPGSMLTFDISHVHKQPPPPQKGVRRSIFISWTAKTDVREVTFDNFVKRFDEFRTKKRKRHC